MDNWIGHGFIAADVATPAAPSAVTTLLDLQAR
jgi:hypothetical protein